MSVKSPNDRILFGLKVKQLRGKKSLSFAELSKRTGISVSYLNEIEKTNLSKGLKSTYRYFLIAH